MMYELNGHLYGYEILPTSSCVDISYFQEDHVLVFKGNESCTDQSYWQLTKLSDLLGTIPYDNTISGLTATTMQGAIDEIVSDTNIELYEDGTDNGIRYTKPNGTIIELKTSHSETITPVPNVTTTITHNLGTARVHVQMYDTTTGDLISASIINKTTTTLDIVSTTADELEIIIKR